MNKLHRAADLRPRSYDPQTNTIDVVWTTGASVRRRQFGNGTTYDEILSLAPGHVRLDRLNAGAPLLDAHDDRRLAAVLGSVVPGSARIESGLGVARVKLSSAEADADVIGKIKDGIIRSISVGYAIHRWQIAPGDTLGTPLARLQELAPRLRGLLPISIGEAAERLGATRQEIEDVAEFDLDHVARRERLVRRNGDLRRADDPFHTTGGVHVR